MSRSVLVALLLCPAAAFADCATPVFICTQDDGARTVEVCNVGADLTYAFGITGSEPDLRLSVPLAAGTFAPWPGVGSSIWESVSFPFDNETVEVWAATERTGEDEPEQGGVRVLAGDVEMSAFDCDAGSVTSDFAGLSDAMYDAGYCWNREEFAWTMGGCE